MITELYTGYQNFLGHLFAAFPDDARDRTRVDLRDPVRPIKKKYDKTGDHYLDACATNQFNLLGRQPAV